MPTFTVKSSDIKKGEGQITGKEAHHLIHVLRAKKGQILKITDGVGNLYEGKIEKVNREVTVNINKKTVSLSPPHPVHLFVSLLKKEKMEFIIEKAVELNIESVQFIKTKHSVRTDISEPKWERIERIALTAQKQCGRPHPIILGKPKPLEETINDKIIEKINHFIFVEYDETNTLKNIFNSFALSPPFGVWIGPEGGWDRDEVLQAKDKGFYSVSLGPLILKAETAAVHAVSTLLAIAS